MNIWRTVPALKGDGTYQGTVLRTDIIPATGVRIIYRPDGKPEPYEIRSADPLVRWLMADAADEQDTYRIAGYVDGWRYATDVVDDDEGGEMESAFWEIAYAIKRGDHITFRQSANYKRTAYYIRWIRIDSADHWAWTGTEHPEDADRILHPYPEYPADGSVTADIIAAVPFTDDTGHTACALSFRIGELTYRCTAEGPSARAVEKQLPTIRGKKVRMRITVRDGKAYATGIENRDARVKRTQPAILNTLCAKYGGITNADIGNQEAELPAEVAYIAGLNYAAAGTLTHIPLVINGKTYMPRVRSEYAAGRQKPGWVDIMAHRRLLYPGLRLRVLVRPSRQGDAKIIAMYAHETLETVETQRNAWVAAHQ